MAETTVTFLTYNPVTQVYIPELRVFELEISAEAQSTYLVLMSQLQQYIDAIVSGSSPAEDEMLKIAKLLRDLETWTKYRYVYEGAEIETKDSIDNPVVPGEFIPLEKLGTMDRYMAEAVDKLIRTVRAAGYDPIMQKYLTPDTSLASIANKLFVTDASLYGFSSTITTGVGAAKQCRIETNVWTQSESIQQLLMVDYVSRGNELLYEEMAKLKEAIDINQSTLSYLNSLQDLMNQKDPERFIMALQSLSGSVGADATKYAEFERLTFNQELENVAKFSENKIEEYLKSILGIPSTVKPKTGEITGTALGAFQAFTDENLDVSLNAYLASKGITTTTMDALVPNISDNPNFDTRMNIFAQTYPLTEDDTELVWRTFLIKEAGISALPSSVDLTSAVTVTHFEEFLESIGIQSPTSTNLPSILQSYLNAYMRPRLESILAEGANAPIAEFDTLFPSGFNSWVASQEVIDANFTKFTLNDLEKLSILRAFLVIRGAALGVEPKEVDMNDPANLAALAAYAAEVSDAMLDPHLTLQNALITDAGVTDISGFDYLYPNGLASWTYDINQEIMTYYDGGNLVAPLLSSEEKLSIFRSFLIKKAADLNITPEAVNMTTYRNEFHYYLQNNFEAVDSSSGLEITLRSYLQPSYIRLIYPTIDDYKYLSPPSLEDQYDPATIVLIKEAIDTGFDSNLTNITPEEYLNIVRGYTISQYNTAYHDLGVVANQNRLRTFVVNYLDRGETTTHATLEEDLVGLINGTGNYTAYATAFSLILSHQFPNNFLSWGATKEVVETNFTSFTLSDSEKLNIVRAFLIQQAGPGGDPTTIDMTNEGNLAALATYVATVSAERTAILISKVQTDAGVPDLSVCYPSDLSSWDKTKAIVEMTFTAFTPTETDKLNIVRAFLIVRGAELGLDPAAVDMNDPVNLDALAEYVFQVSSDSKVLSAAWLTSLPELSVVLYEDLLLEQFPDANGFTATDRLNIWKAFLISKGLSSNDDVPATGSATRAILSSYLADMAPVIGTTTGIRLVDVLYENLYFKIRSERKANASSVFNTLLTTVTDFPENSFTLEYKISNAFGSYYGYTTTDRLNVWRTFLASQGISSLAGINTNGLEERCGDLAEAAQAFVGDVKGDELVSRLLDFYALYGGYVTLDDVTAMKPTMQSYIDAGIGFPSTPAVRGEIDSIINDEFTPYSYSEADRLSLWRAFMIFEGKTDPATYTSTTSVQGLEDFLDDLNSGYPLGILRFFQSPVTGSVLVDALDLYQWLPPYDSFQITESIRSSLVNGFPLSAGYTAKDWLNIWKAFLISTADMKNYDPNSYNHNDVGNVLTFFSNIKNWTQRTLTESGGTDSSIVLTGDALINAIHSYFYSIKPSAEAKDFTDLSTVTTIPATSTINYDTIIDDTVGFDLEDEQKLRIWQAFLAGDAGATDSEAIIDVSTQATVDRFKAFLTSIAANDIGAAIDTRIQRIITNLKHLSNMVSNAAGSSGSPLQKELDRVRQDFEGLLTNNQPIKTWVEDYEQGRAGDYQKHLNDAIVASQALNDTEREELRRVMFVYEEFYKSATAMLSKLTQLIEKMASAISR